MTFFEKEDYTYEDIESLINNNAEESLHLEFKEARALSKEDKYKAEITKDVSAFANSDGGIIIYGIQEKEHKASHITPIDGNIFTKEWLELVINSGIERRIPNLRIYPIHNNGDISQTIYIVKIPASMEAPHMNKEKLFYRRFNFQSVKMEEYEIRLLYSRKNQSKLLIHSFYVYFKKEDAKNKRNDSRTINFVVNAYNDSKIFEKEYKTNIIFNNISKFKQIYWEQRHKISDTYLGSSRYKFSNEAPCTIYPNESIKSLELSIEIENEFIEQFINNCTIDIYLFYSSGEASLLNENIKHLIEDLSEDSKNQE